MLFLCKKFLKNSLQTLANRLYILYNIYINNDSGRDRGGTNMKLSKAQQWVLDVAKHEIAVMSKYKNFADFFDNSVCEQNYLRTAAHCNGAWNSSQKWIQNDIVEWKRMEQVYNAAVNEHIIEVFAKNETIDALERAGAIVVIKRARASWDTDTIKIL